MSLSNSSKIDSEYLFNIDDYKPVGKRIVGGYGTVRIVENKNDKKKYVIKTNLPKNNKPYRLYISREIQILIRVQHPTIVPFRGFSYVDLYKKENFTILMDYMENDSLSNYILHKRSKKYVELNNTQKQIILVGIARGMMLLHKLHVIHRDLKPENILLDSDYHPHITDFGLSKFFDPSDPNQQSIDGLSTERYMAPEFASGNEFDIKADVFSFGVLMYELITEKEAYSYLGKLNSIMLAIKIKEGNLPIKDPENFDEPIKSGLKAMMRSCWSKSPQERPSFTEIFKKLSLSNDEFLLGIENNLEKDVIEDFDDDDDDSDDDKDKRINTKFCLNDVDHAQVLKYVDEILVEPKSHQDKEIESLKKEITELKTMSSLKPQEKDSIADDKIIVNLKKEVDELKEKTENQETVISQIQKEEPKKIDEDYEFMKIEISELKEKTKSQQSTIMELKSKLTEQDSLISALKDKVEKNDFNEILNNIFENIDQLSTDLKKKNAKQNDQIKNLEERIQQQEEIIQQQKKIIDQQKEQYKKNHDDLADQLEFCRDQIKQLNNKINEQNKLTIEKQKIVNDDEESNPDEDKNKKSDEESSSKSEEESTSKSDEESSSESDEESDKIIHANKKKDYSFDDGVEINNISDREIKIDEDDIDERGVKSNGDVPYDDYPYLGVAQIQGIIDKLGEGIKISAGNDQEQNISIIRNPLQKPFCNYNSKERKPTKEDAFILFDFGEYKKVGLSAYLIMSGTVYYPRSWRVEGSNDGLNWTDIDKQTNDIELKRHKYASHAYEFDESDQYRYIRYFQDESWTPSKPHWICISFFELYGRVYKYD